MVNGNGVAAYINIRAFRNLERTTTTTGTAVSDTLLATLVALIIPLEDRCGQGFDGAASMVMVKGRRLMQTFYPMYALKVV